MESNDYFETEYLRQNLKQRALKSAGATVFAQTCNYGIQTAGAIILARILTPDDFGLIAMVAAFSLLFQNFGVNGFTEVIIQQEKINHRQLSTLFWINLSISLALTILLIVSSPCIAAFYNEPRLKSVTIALAFTIIFSGIGTHHSALLKRNLQFYRTSANEIIAAFCSVFIAIILALNGWGYWALIVRQLSLTMLVAVGAWILCKWRPGLPALGVGTKPMVKFAINTYGTFCLTYLQRNIDKVLIGRILGSQPLGHYDRAQNLASMLPNQLTFPLTSVALATLSRISNDAEQFRHYLSRVLSMLSFFALPLSVVLTLTGKDFIYLFLGPQWDQAGNIFSILSVSTGMMILYGTHGWLHLSLGRADRWLRWNIIALVVTSIFFLIGLRFGPLGVAAAYTASIYTLIIPALWYAGKPGGIKLTLIIASVWKYFIAALITGLLTGLLLYLFAYSSAWFLNMNIMLRIFAVSVFCFFFYLVLVIVFNKGLRPIRQFASVLHDMRPSRK